MGHWIEDGIVIEQAERFGRWIEAWNRHDLDGIMAHYADDVVFASPFVTILINKPDGTLHSASALRTYFSKGLGRLSRIALRIA